MQIKIVFENGHFKCVFCDAVFTDSTADRAAFQYASQISQANEHLRIGNLDRAYEIAMKASDMHPADSQPYYIILFAITSNLTAYKLSDGKRKEAVDIWTKLEQLNAIAQPLAVYSQNMSQEKIKRLKGKYYPGSFIYEFRNCHAYSCFFSVSGMDAVFLSFLISFILAIIAG